MVGNTYFNIMWLYVKAYNQPTYIMSLFMTTMILVYTLYKLKSEIIVLNHYCHNGTNGWSISTQPLAGPDRDL